MAQAGLLTRWILFGAALAAACSLGNYECLEDRSLEAALRQGETTSADVSGMDEGERVELVVYEEGPTDRGSRHVAAWRTVGSVSGAVAVA